MLRPASGRCQPNGLKPAADERVSRRSTGPVMQNGAAATDVTQRRRLQANDRRYGAGRVTSPGRGRRLLQWLTRSGCFAVCSARIPAGLFKVEDGLAEYGPRGSRGTCRPQGTPEGPEEREMLPVRRVYRRVQDDSRCLFK